MNEDIAMDTKRGDDAQDHAPKPSRRETVTLDRKPEEGTDEERSDHHGAIEVENMSSANDEGAN